MAGFTKRTVVTVAAGAMALGAGIPLPPSAVGFTASTWSSPIRPSSKTSAPPSW